MKNWKDNDVDDGKDDELSQPWKMNQQEKTLHIAPMIRVSNREFRQLIRILSKRCVVWTEMVVDETIFYCSRSKAPSTDTGTGIHGAFNREKVDDHLDYDRSTEHPIVCQIGGMDPELTAFTSRIVAEEYGYDEINLNMDCPSDRVKNKDFGAILMQSNKVNKACAIIKSMKENSSNVTISVKLRIGIDDMESYEFIHQLIQRLHEAGSDKFYLHARKVLMRGLSPLQNRIVPPLNYPIVYRLCRDFPKLEFLINGGISGLRAAKAIVYGEDEKDWNDDIDVEGGRCRNVHHSVPCSVCNYPNGSCIAPPSKSTVPPNLRGCMLGRAAMDNPSLFWDCDRYFYGEDDNPCQTRREVLIEYINYLESNYPRRCCDDLDDVQTNRLPSPSVIHKKDYCDVCSKWRKKNNGEKFLQTKMNHPANKLAPNNSNNFDDRCCPSNNKSKSGKVKLKITSHVIARSLRPILGLFFGLSTSKAFRRKCDELVDDLTIRNCGPAFVLVSVLQTVPDDVLDRKFIRTEDLPSSNVVEHVSPQELCSSTKVQ